MRISRIWGNWFSSYCPDIYPLVHGKQKMICCTDDCRQGRDCPHRKVYKMDKIKTWGVAFIIGATLGMLVEKEIIVREIQKDCSVLLAFRINDLPYTCKPYLTK